jgi:hypothetical protein
MHSPTITEVMIFITTNCFSMYVAFSALMNVCALYVCICMCVYACLSLLGAAKICAQEGSHIPWPWINCGRGKMFVKADKVRNINYMHQYGNGILGNDNRNE